MGRGFDGLRGRVVYCDAVLESEEKPVGWIFLTMLAMIGGSIVIELILPMRIKERMGAAICWSMMAVTMTFLGAASLGLLAVIWVQFVQPLLTG